LMQGKGNRGRKVFESKKSQVQKRTKKNMSSIEKERLKFSNLSGKNPNAGGQKAEGTGLRGDSQEGEKGLSYKTR